MGIEIRGLFLRLLLVAVPFVGDGVDVIAAVELLEFDVYGPPSFEPIIWPIDRGWDICRDM